MRFRSKRHVRCTNCDYIIPINKMLTAKNPFDAKDKITGCPMCKQVNTMVIICEIEGCKNYLAAGMKINENYRLLCSKHFQELNE